MPPETLINAVNLALPGLPQDWQPLGGGRTNRVWRLGEVVVKLYDPKAATALFPNNPQDEQRALMHYGPLDLAPNLLASGQNWLAYSYLTGRAWEAGTAAVARLLAAVHGSPPPAGLRVLSSGWDALQAQTQQMLHIAGLSHPLPAYRDVPPILPQALHGDAVAGNMIETPDGLRLIDWQCPALGDPAEDLATFLSPAMQTIYRGTPLSAAEVATFLNSYPDRVMVDRYLLLRPLFHLRMAAHCAQRAQRGDTGYANGLSQELAALAPLVSP